MLSTLLKIESTEVSAGTESGARFWLPLVGILAVATVMYATFAVSWLKFSRAEVFFSECAREMIALNNMVTPLYHGQPFFDKPIWSYWLIIAMFKTFGVAHWAARVPSIIASVGTIAVTAWVTRQIAVGSGGTQKGATTAGLLSAMLLASSFMFFSFSYLCMSDMTLVLCDTLTLALAYYGIVNDKRRSLAWWLASVSMGFAFITKGPIGIVLPGIAVVAYLGLTRQLKLIKPLHVLLGGITAAIIAFPWFFAAFKANGSWALAYFFIRENFVRYTGTMYDTHKPLWFMVQSLALGFLPWTVFIPFALHKQLPEMKASVQTRANDPKLYMWLWTAVLIGFFSFSRGKCDYYALPVYPAVASLVALYLAGKADGKFLRVSATGLSIVALAAGLLSPLLMWEFSSHASFGSWWMMPAAFVIAGAAGLVACANKKVMVAFTTLFIGLSLGLAGFASQMFPIVIASQSIDVYAKAIAATEPATRIGVHKDLHHWVDELTFQSQREPVEMANAAALGKLFTSGPALALIPEEAYHQALAEVPELQTVDLKILDRRRVSSHPLTPGYVLKRKGNIFDNTLLLVSN